MNAQSHWSKVYTDKIPAETSWHQAVPSTSLAMIDQALSSAALRAEQQLSIRVIDIGGGASTLVDHLLKREHFEVCVTDIAGNALHLAQARLGPSDAARVRWLEADAAAPMATIPDAWADIWHDRAAFHFLITPEARLAYAHNLVRIVRPGGTAIIATFAPDGPEKCSNLPVQRHDASSIAAEISRSGRAFTLTDSRHEKHTTPWGSTQSFVYAMLQG